MARSERQTKRQEAAPSADDFSRWAVERAVLLDTLQHPFTILPAAAAALGAAWIGLLGPDPLPVAATLVSGLFAAGAWVVNFFFRGEALARAHVERLGKRRQRASLEKVESLERAWEATGFDEGIKQARELRQAYSGLVRFLDERLATRGGLQAQRLKVLAEDTYREGMAILRSALSTYRAVASVDRGPLEEELSAWESQLDDLDPDDPRRASLRKRIAGHRRRLELHSERRRSLEELLAESEVLEAALESARLEVVDLDGGDRLFRRGDAASSLERAVAAARRVETRLRGDLAEEEEAVYLEASEAEAGER